MSDLLSGPVTPFDGAAVIIILMSALMALARGFMRELATLGAFIAAVAATYFAVQALGPWLAAQLPEDTDAWIPDVTIAVVVFIAVYVIIAWLGARLSRLVHGLEGMGVLDRAAGFAFGTARGVVAVTFFTLLINQSLTRDRTPSWILNARLYPFFHSAASLVQSSAPKIAAEVEERLPEDTSESR